MVLVTTEGPALPPAIRNRLQCLPPHQQADLYFVYRHELENEGAARNSTTDWLRRLQRAREFSWLATVPPEERHRYASLPAEDRRLLAEMHRTCASHLTGSKKQIWERCDWKQRIEWLAEEWVTRSLASTERAIFERMDERSKLPFLRPLPTCERLQVRPS